MSEFAGAEILGPGEGAGAASEGLSEEAKQRFAAAAAAMIQIQREEKRSKKRDTRVARTILQFLNDDRYAHLFILISRLVARDCPSVFILAILSLINEDCRTVVKEYLEEMQHDMEAAASDIIDDDMQIVAGKSAEGGTGRSLDARANRILIAWITRMQMVMSRDARKILGKLMVDPHSIDGTVLQLATFILQEFFKSKDGGGRSAQFEQLQGLTISILQTVFEPFLNLVELPKTEKPPDNNND